ncbi:hypothetical protein, partial [Microseira wollei]|uniref:hypothetical protein n=1 Tax=Microseira wollei TaxID=467598 RepID=UPI001CFD541E
MPCPDKEWGGRFAGRGTACNNVWYQPKMAECRAPTTINQCRGTASITFGINQRWQNAVPRQPSINVG